MSDEASEGWLGAGTIIEVEVELGSGDYTKLAQVRNIKGPNFEAEDVEITNNDSPNLINEYIPGFADAGNADFELLYKRANQSVLYGLLRKKRNYRMTYGDFEADSGGTGSKWEFLGYINKFGTESETKAAMKNTASIKFASAPEFTEGSGGSST